MLITSLEPEGVSPPPPPVDMMVMENRLMPPTFVVNEMAPSLTTVASFVICSSALCVAKPLTTFRFVVASR